MYSQALSNDTLRFEQFKIQLLENYPIIKKAELNDEIALAYTLKGKGTLDPKFYTSFDSKQFDGSHYFNIWQSEVKLPTALPVDFSLGYENNRGLFLNSENAVPLQGLVYGGLNVSLLRGLMFDEQRHALRTAEVLESKSLIDRQSIIREVVMQGSMAYLEWAGGHYHRELLEDYLTVVNDRHLNVIQLYINGDIPAVDTIESRLNLNTASKFLLEAAEDLIRKRQKLNLFLWDENTNPLILASETLPETLDNLIKDFNEVMLTVDPNFEADLLVQKIENDISGLELDRKLEKEFLKPQLDLKLNSLVNLGKEEFSPTFSANDYKVGINVAVPLRNRKTRGQLKLLDAQIEQTKLDGLYYTQSLANEYESIQQEISIRRNIIEVLNTKLKNSQILYDAEQLKFGLGESSVFLLNQRERKLLEAQQELLKSKKQLSSLIVDLYFFKLGQINVSTRSTNTR